MSITVKKSIAVTYDATKGFVPADKPASSNPVPCTKAALRFTGSSASDSQVKRITVSLSPSEIAAAKKCSENFYSSRNKSIIADPSDKFKAERAGILGEIAVAKHLGLSPNLEEQKWGKEDLKVGSFTMEIKTTTGNFSTGMVRATKWNDPTTLVPLTAAAYIFCRYISDSEIEIIGCCKKEDLRQGGLHAAYNGKHKNYLVYHNDLKPISQLKTFIAKKLETT